MEYVLGLDAGGTKTDTLVCDTEGNIAGYGRGGPANYKLVGAEKAAAGVEESVLQAVDDRGDIKDNLVCGFYALSGLDFPADREVIDSFISEVNPADTYFLEVDAVVPLYLATADGTGVVVICGTGSNCIGINSAGERLQIGGLGREFGDYAGGSEIAVQAMGRAMRGFDGRGRPTILYEYITEYLGVENLAEFEPELRQNEADYSLADMAPLVFRAAREGDRVAWEILRFNGEEMALSVNTTISRLFAGEEDIDVVLTGGVFRGKGDFVTGPLREKVQEKNPDTRFILPEGDPVVGSLIQALRLGGVEVNSELKEKLLTQYTTKYKSK